MPTERRLPYLYLAGPITGLPDLNRPAFTAAASELRKLGYRVFNPHEVVHGKTKTQLARMAPQKLWLFYMHILLEKIGTHQLEACFYLPGSDNSRGATTERLLFTSLELPVIPFVAGWSVRDYRRALALAATPAAHIARLQYLTAVRTQLLEAAQASSL